MNKIKIISKSYYLDENMEKSWFYENIGSEFSVNDNDLLLYKEDKKFLKNETMASHLLYTISKTIDLSSEKDNIKSEKTGISFGTRYGCMSDVEKAEKKIRAKGERGISPKVFTNTIPCGAASKTAIKIGCKAFNITNYNGNNSGTDALIISCDMLNEKRCEYAFSSCGDDECGVYASIMLKCSDENDDLVSITSYSKGMVYGENIIDQIDFILKKSLDDAYINSSDRTAIFIISETDSDESSIRKSCENIFKNMNVDINSLKFNDKIYSAKGMLAVMYADKYIKKNNADNAVIVQLSENKYFSCVILEK